MYTEDFEKADIIIYPVNKTSVDYRRVKVCMSRRPGEGPSRRGVRGHPALALSVGEKKVPFKSKIT